MEIQNKFHFINQSQDLHYEVNDFKEAVLNFFLFSDTDLILNLYVDVEQEAKLSINLSGLFFKKQNSQINIFTKNMKNYGQTEIKTFCVLKDESVVHVNLNCDVKPHTIQNKVVQKIDGILLSEKAKMTGQPNLKIDTDDIIATHALNIGALNKEEMFYLMSKQVSYKDARSIILWSRLTYYFEDIENKEMYENLIKDVLYE